MGDTTPSRPRRKPRIRVLVYGPSTSGVFGADEYHVKSMDDIVVDADSGLLSIRSAERGLPRTMTYPRGGWTRYATTVIPSRPAPVRPTPSQEDS